MSVARLIRARIERGTMPATLDELLERRGSLESAARDLSAFADADYAACMEGINEVYGR